MINLDDVIQQKRDYLQQQYVLLLVFFYRSWLLIKSLTVSKKLSDQKSMYTYISSPSNTILNKYSTLNHIIIINKLSPAVLRVVKKSPIYLNKDLGI